MTVPVVSNTVGIDPGPPTQLSTQLPAGTIISNQDSSNAIWLSENSSVSPGNGTRVGPLGSTTWQLDREAPWVCVDTGVTSQVLIGIGNTFTDTDNPVDVGVAVATQILETGIPGIGILKQLFNNTLHYNDSTGNIPVAAYSSLVITQIQASGGTSICVIMTDGTHNVYLEYFELLGNTPIVIACESAAVLTVVNVGLPGSGIGHDVALLVSGGNYVPNVRTDTRYNATGIATGSTASIAMTAGSEYPMVGSYQQVLQGPVYSRFYLTGGTAVRGYFVVYDSNNHAMAIATTDEMVNGVNGFSVNKPMGLPAGTTVNDIAFRCTTAGTAAAIVALCAMSL